MHRRMYKRTPVFWVTALLLAGCNNTEEKLPVRSSVDDLYISYNITGDQDKESVTCMMQFREGGPDGKGLLLENGAGVSLDGQVLMPDSARLSGVYYETEQPVSGFEGKHNIVYTDATGKKFTEHFEFHPFQLSPLPETVDRSGFDIELGNFPTRRTRVQLMLTDTAFRTNDAIEWVVVTDGRLPVTSTMLNKLSAGPVFVEIYREEDRPLQQIAGAAGRIRISYGVRGSFLLVGN